MAYDACIALPNGESVDAVVLADALADYASEAGVDRMAPDAEKLELFWDEWSLRLWITSDMGHIEEMREAVRAKAPNHPNNSVFESATTLIEVAGDDDWDMDYFNDYLITVEELLLRIPGSVGIEMTSGVWFGSEKE